MIHRENNTIRPRNVEDINELEEKGLLRRVDDDSHDTSPTRRRAKGKEKETRLERVPMETDYSTGLTTRRDKQAFALLVLLFSKVSLSASHSVPSHSSSNPTSPTLNLRYSLSPPGHTLSNFFGPLSSMRGSGLWVIGGKIEEWLNVEEADIKFLTAVFGSLILAAATQDIAVDGWALTLLSQPNLSYASTAQTIGIGIGNALSFTVFLAFNSVEFSNKYFRSPSQPLDYPLVSLGGYMRFWAVVFVGVTVGLAVLKKEDPPSEDDPDMDVKKVYKVMWSIVRLKNIQTFLFVHLICKIGFQVNDSVTSLKLLEKGLSKEDLAVAVLLDFPAQMAVGWLAAKWSRPAPSSSHPLTAGAGGGESGNVLKPWLYAFWARLAMATISTFVVAGFPSNRAGSTSVGTTYFLLVIATTLFSSLTSTVQFVGICAFHTQIADPLIGGTYMTLLNTVSNLGGTWPKPLILRAVDMLTVATCSPPSSSTSWGSKLSLSFSSSTSDVGECVTEHGKNLCAQAGGECIMQRDGYYIMSAVCVTLGAGLLVVFILPMIRRLADGDEADSEWDWVFSTANVCMASQDSKLENTKTSLKTYQT
ncbi:acetyl-CoA transporter [Cryptococcus deuterogattii LA55]|nr:acetyl-CoA transporter [Cryptococcus deuterogattii LA55]KIR90034.1 acetyl-CoA transporter [Cryptococcus deuterogattii CBS 10090]